MLRVTGLISWYLVNVYNLQMRIQIFLGATEAITQNVQELTSVAFVGQPNSVFQSSVCCLDAVRLDLSGEIFGAGVSCSCCERQCMGRRTDD